MDEEQGLASPIAGGLRGIRRSVSASIFTGRAAPQQVQGDTISQNLIYSMTQDLHVTYLCEKILQPLNLYIIFNFSIWIGYSNSM